MSLRIVYAHPLLRSRLRAHVMCPENGMCSGEHVIIVHVATQLTPSLVCTSSRDTTIDWSG
eukprot:m.332540 g.332540  ORF g.332540 m.332540 type:complete len:61 (+) comp27729_c0_seq3:555-737(+)